MVPAGVGTAELTVTVAWLEYAVASGVWSLLYNTTLMLCEPAASPVRTNEVEAVAAEYVPSTKTWTWPRPASGVPPNAALSKTKPVTVQAIRRSSPAVIEDGAVRAIDGVTTVKAIVAKTREPSGLGSLFPS